jgi:hypothetical protein
VVNIGWFGAQAFLEWQSKEYQNTTISLTADKLTFNKVSKICKEKTGLKMPATFSVIA